MGKTIPMTAKFTEEEADRIDSFAVAREMSRSAALHELIMKGFEATASLIPESDKDAVRFRFTANYLYFFKGHDYPGFVRDDEAHIKFGGEWMIYKLDDLPAEIIGG